MLIKKVHIVNKMHYLNIEKSFYEPILTANKQ